MAMNDACVQCGNPLPAGARHCIRCGYPVAVPTAAVGQRASRKPWLVLAVLAPIAILVGATAVYVAAGALGPPAASPTNPAVAVVATATSPIATSTSSPSPNPSSAPPAPTPTAAPTPEPTPVLTPEPTPVPTPEPTPVPTPEPTPTATPTPEPTPTPTPHLNNQQQLLAAIPEWLRPACKKSTSSDPSIIGYSVVLQCDVKTDQVLNVRYWLYPDVGSLSDEWTRRMNALSAKGYPTGQGDCWNGVEGQSTHARGDMQCDVYQADGSLEVRWDDLDHLIYAVVNGEPGDIASLVAWWSQNAVLDGTTP